MLGDASQSAGTLLDAWALSSEYLKRNDSIALVARIRSMHGQLPLPAGGLTHRTQLAWRNELKILSSL